MTEPSAKVIADSLHPNGHCRLTTMEVVFPRIVLAELNTHRKFSRNSASSRAIPFDTMVQRVMEDPFIPLVWAAEQRGMQGGDELTGFARKMVEWDWLKARDAAVGRATMLHKQGLHKSIVNRLLEPFMWHTAIISSTEWDNFFAQRCSPLAQPELRVAAEAMRSALEKSDPVMFDYGVWHTPYVEHYEHFANDEDPRHVSAARCARVSYLTHDGRRDPQKDVELYEKLITADPPHASPLEHVATPGGVGIWSNFDGWLQLRHQVL